MSCPLNQICCNMVALLSLISDWTLTRWITAIFSLIWDFQGTPTSRHNRCIFKLKLNILFKTVSLAVPKTQEELKLRFINSQLEDLQRSWGKLLLHCFLNSMIVPHRINPQTVLFNLIFSFQLDVASKRIRRLLRTVENYQILRNYSQPFKQTTTDEIVGFIAALRKVKSG